MAAEGFVGWVEGISERAGRNTPVRRWRRRCEGMTARSRRGGAAEAGSQDVFALFLGRETGFAAGQ